MRTWKDCLHHVIDECKIPVMGEYLSRATIASGDDYQNAWTNNRRDIIGLLKGYGDPSGRARGTKIKRFRFMPKRAGLLVIDIDRHDGQADGLEAFYKYLSQSNIDEPTLKDIENGSFPCFVTTPNNGFHLYFRYSGNENFPKRFTDGVEIFYSDGASITVPGSRDDNGKDYILYGDIRAPPFLLPPLHKLLVSKIPTYKSPLSGKRKYSLNKIADFVEYDNRSSGRNDKSFLIACRARREGYSKEEVLQFLRSYSGLGGLPEKEIMTSVASAYKENVYGAG